MWNFRRHRHLKLEMLSEYLDGRLGTADRSRVTRHLDSCEPCRNELGSLRSTVNLLQALPEVAPPRSFTLAAPPVPGPLTVRQPLPLRAPGWAYAGAASLAGLALAVLVSADNLGLLSPAGRAEFPVLSAQRSAPPSPIAASPEADSSTAMATSPPQIASGEPYDAGPPETDSIQALSATDALPEPTVAAPEMAPPDHGEQSETAALAAGPAPGAADATELRDTETEVAGLSEKSAGPGADPSVNATEDGADPEFAGPLESGPDSEAVLTPAQYRGTPIVWRVLEGIAAFLALASLGILVIKRQRSRRIGG